MIFFQTVSRPSWTHLEEAESSSRHDFAVYGQPYFECIRYFLWLADVHVTFCRSHTVPEVSCRKP